MFIAGTIIIDFNCCIAMYSLTTLFRKVLLADLLGQAHINICVALLCGLVTFLSGIETASNHKVLCNYITMANILLVTINVLYLGCLYNSGITFALLFSGSVLLDAV